MTDHGHHEHGHDHDGGHSAHPHADHGGGHDKHAGHSLAMFRDRFWLCRLLTLPVVLFSGMIQDWFGYFAPTFPDSE